MHFTVNHHDDPVSGILEEHGGRVIGTMTWDDSKAVVFETKPVTRDNGYQSRRRYWIDPTRGYIVVRRQFLQPQNEGGRWTVSDQIDGRQHKEVQPGIWLPTKVEMTKYWVPKDEARHMTGKDVVEISEWRVNEEFPDDYFELGPTEYEVQDQDQREVRP